MRLDFAKELWKFLRVRKKFWLTPVIVIMCGLGGLLVLAEDPVSLAEAIGQPQRVDTNVAAEDTTPSFVRII